MPLAASILRYTVADYFIFRTPLLPFETWCEWSEGLQSIHAVHDPQLLEQALRDDSAKTRSLLGKLIEHPEIHEALMLASAELIDGLAHWKQDPDSKRGAKAERSLFRYVTRMCFRCTPFGLFAGCATGTIGQKTDLVLAAKKSSHRVTRVDNEILANLCGTLIGRHDVRRELRLLPNTSCLPGAGRIRYHETRLGKNFRTYFLTAVDDSPALRTALARARNGATHGEITAAVAAEDPELDITEVEAFVDELVVTQVLVSELDLPVTGQNPVDAIARLLSRCPSTASLADTLTHISGMLGELDKHGIGAHSDQYSPITALVSSLGEKVTASRVFQVDLITHAPDATLDQAVIDELKKGVNALHRLRMTVTDPLRDFREAFQHRYEEQQVPLLEALDEQTGIGLGTHWLEKQQIAIPWAPWTPAHGLLLERLIRCAEERQNEIVLTDADLATLDGTSLLPLPDSFECLCTLIAGSSDAITQGDYQITLGWVVSALNLAGRFCHAHPDLHERLRKHLRAEEALRPEAIFAEIVHLPQGRVGNVICRPVLRDYEIPYLGLSGARPDQQITLDDLLVSVKNGRVVIHSRRLGREVLPRMSTAHNHFHEGNLPIYRFLCDIQKQQVVSGVGFEWGVMGHQRHLPRVRYGRIILSSEQWRISGDELRRLKGNRAQSFSAMQILRRERSLPRFILYSGANQDPFVIDLDQPLSVDCLIDELDGQHQALLTEAIRPDSLCAVGPEGHFYHELVIPFVRSMEPAPKTASIKPVLLPTVPAGKRSFIAGSPWLYLKLYSGRGICDNFLSASLASMLRPLLASGAIQRWFFIRYADPQPHVRLRLYGDPQRLAHEVQPHIQTCLAPLMENGWFWRVTYDTYQRETERYGGPESIDFAEKLFHVDSEASLRLIEQYPGEAANDLRWRLALRGCEGLMAAAELTLPQRRNVLRRSLGLPPIGTGRTTNLHQLNDHYRAQRAAVQEVLAPADALSNVLQPGAAILRHRDELSVPIFAELRTLEQDGRLTSSLADLINSFLHMSINRLLRTDPRMHEPMIYDFLDRTYHAAMARSKEVLCE